MFFCMSCKKQFNEGMTRFGECPFCGTTSSYAKRRCELQEFTIKKNFDTIEEIKKLIKKLGR